MEEGRFDELGEGSGREQESEVGNLTQLGREKSEWAWFRGGGAKKSFLDSGGSEAVGACLVCRGLAELWGGSLTGRGLGGAWPA